MVPPVKGSGMGGCKRLYVGRFLLGSGSGSDNLWSGYVGDVSTHQEESGRISPLVNTRLMGRQTRWKADKSCSYRPTGNVDVRGGLRGGRDIRCPPPEHRLIFYLNHNHHGSLTCCGAVPWGAGVQEVVGTGYPGNGGDAGYGNGGVNGGDGGRG